MVIGRVNEFFIARFNTDTTGLVEMSASKFVF